MCPDCSTKIQCGTGGLQNLKKRHRGGPKCMNAKMKRDKDAKTRKNGSIMTFMKQKAPTVPSTVLPAPIIHTIRTKPGPSHSILTSSSVEIG